jgi:GrpB-like predicted nucleotidyltransferase (UPF0157 family)
MNKIEVVDYDRDWPVHFERLQMEIQSRLGELLSGIHHIGSTSVPGLMAKPKIDIDAVVRSEALLPDAIARMQMASEYTFHGDPYRDGMWTFTSGHGSRGARLYICAPDTPTHTRRVLFRDWLRSHPQDAETYATLKRRLALEANGDWTYYTIGKSTFVADIVSRATAG